MRETDIQISNMRKITTIICKSLIVFQLECIIMTQQSIVGITYRDNFDFEERYRNLHECDPFYWHPLHLPEQCAEMFENLIKSRVAAVAKRPVRVVTKKERYVPSNSDIYSLQKFYRFTEPDYGYPLYETEYIYRDDNSPEQFEQDKRTRYLSPYEKMIELLRQDVRKNPTAPVIGMSNYGPIALYKQPVSRKSKNIINKIAGAYANAGRQNMNDNDEYYYGKIEISPTNNDTISIHKENGIINPNIFYIENSNQGSSKHINANSKKKKSKQKKKLKKNKKKGLAIE